MHLGASDSTTSCTTSTLEVPSIPYHILYGAPMRLKPSKAGRTFPILPSISETKRTIQKFGGISGIDVVVLCNLDVWG